MRFSSRQVNAIVRGEITQARRPPGAKLKPGKSVAVQRVDSDGRVHSTEHRIIVLAVKDTVLGDINFQDARAEGHRTTDEALEQWRSPSGRISRGRRVQLVRFCLDRSETPLFLRRTGAAIRGQAHDAAEHGYTSNPHDSISPDAESVPLAVLAQYAREASVRDDLMRRERLRLGSELARAGVDALRSGLADGAASRDVKRTVRAIEHHVQALARKLGEA